MKYYFFLPPLTSPFEQIADVDNAVRVVTNEETKTIRVASPMPALPTTHERRMNSITPHMFRRHRTWKSFTVPIIYSTSLIYEKCSETIKHLKQ